ncbi:hypothetical protein C8R45DRAFT_929321 [Mycena sanguinolenta]|nr:hypothetical protein C8R45DRAFT_929184 [Mycena sanguinolenta]KAJ6490027.1 hypothetical protein C8R45DRAFT_929321 [Mycena sanguinolenta]
MILAEEKSIAVRVTDGSRGSPRVLPSKPLPVPEHTHTSHPPRVALAVVITSLRGTPTVIHQLEVKHLTSRSRKHLSKTAGQKMSIAEMADRVATVDSYFVPQNLVLSVAPVITEISKSVYKLQGNVL